MLRFHGAGMTEGTRVLLLVLAGYMDGRRYVSVPRSQLAAELDVAPARITERIAIASELGLLGTVQAGRPGRTATYQGMFAAEGLAVRTKTKRSRERLEPAADGTHVRTSDLVRGNVPSDPPPLGTHVPAPIGKRSATDAPRPSSSSTQGEPPVLLLAVGGAPAMPDRLNRPTGSKGRRKNAGAATRSAPPILDSPPDGRSDGTYREAGRYG